MSTGNNELQALERIVMARTKSRTARASGVATDPAEIDAGAAEQSAISELQKIISETQDSGGSKDPRLADMLSSLAALYDAAGDAQNAESALARAIEIRSRFFGKDSLVVGHTMQVLAELNEREGKLLQAEKLYSSSLAIAIRQFGTADSETRHLVDKLRNVMSQQNRNPDEASRFAAGIANSAMNDALDAFPCDQYRELGQAALQIRNYKEAERIFACLRDVTMALSPNSVHYAQALESLAQTYYLQERTEEAFRMRDRAMQKYELLLGPQDPTVLAFAAKTAALRKESGKIAAAQTRLQRMATHRPAVLAACTSVEDRTAALALEPECLLGAQDASDDERIWKEYFKDGTDALQKSNTAEAERLLSLCVEKAEILNPHDWRLWNSMCELAAAYTAGGKLYKAASMYQQLLRRCEQQHGAESPTIVPYLVLVANNHEEQGEFVKVKECYERIVRIYTNARAPESIVQPYQSRLHELQADFEV